MPNGNLSTDDNPRLRTWEKSRRRRQRSRGPSDDDSKSQRICLKVNKGHFFGLCLMTCDEKFISFVNFERRNELHSPANVLSFWVWGKGLVANLIDRLKIRTKLE
jgi:hypothetical protein